ncbi:MAG: hypothetical protein UX09_C0053G0006, partial [Candidatus Uhrbacteria bacterium GW2011_GWE2_45_35]
RHDGADDVATDTEPLGAHERRTEVGTRDTHAHAIAGTQDLTVRGVGLGLGAGHPGASDGAVVGLLEGGDAGHQATLGGVVLGAADAVDHRLEVGDPTLGVGQLVEDGAAGRVGLGAAHAHQDPAELPVVVEQVAHQGPRGRVEGRAGAVGAAVELIDKLLELLLGGRLVQEVDEGTGLGVVEVAGADHADVQVGRRGLDDHETIHERSLGRSLWAHALTFSEEEGVDVDHALIGLLSLGAGAGGVGGQLGRAHEGPADPVATAEVDEVGAVQTGPRDLARVDTQDVGAVDGLLGQAEGTLALDSGRIVAGVAGGQEGIRDLKLLGRIQGLVHLAVAVVVDAIAEDLSGGGGDAGRGGGGGSGGGTTQRDGRSRRLLRRFPIGEVVGRMPGLPSRRDVGWQVLNSDTEQNNVSRSARVFF